MTAPDPLADVFDDTADAPLPVVWFRGHRTLRPILLPHPDDPRWTPTEEAAS